MGYDPSRIEQWLRLIPSPQPSQVVTTRDHTEPIEMSAAQGPVAGQSPYVDGVESAGSAIFSVPAASDHQLASLNPPKAKKAK